jgi:plastocyanin
VSANVQSHTFKSRHRRRLAGAAAAAVGLLAVAGCGSSSSSNTTSSSATTATTPAAPAPTTPAAPAPTTSTSAPTSAPTSGPQSLSLSANSEGQLAFNTKALSAKAGTISIAFANSSSLPHNVTIEAASGEKVGATETFAGGSKTLTVSLKAGTYKFYCSVPGHRQAGMEGTLTVQ